MILIFDQANIKVQKFEENTYINHSFCYLDLWRVYLAHFKHLWREPISWRNILHGELDVIESINGFERLHGPTPPHTDILYRAFLLFFLFDSPHPRNSKLPLCRFGEIMAQPNKQGKQKNKTRRPFQMNSNRLVVYSPRFIVNKFEHVWAGGVYSEV